MTSLHLPEIVAFGAIREGVPSSMNTRLAWVDNLRTTVVLLAVNLHCCVTYSYVGGWYLNDGPERGLAEKLPYVLWEFHLQSFFMGLMFFIAGTFADGALRRHGPVSFLRERMVRLGLPALLYMIVIQPLILFGLLADPASPTDLTWPALYTSYLASSRVISGSGPMWFALALLMFCVLLVAWRVFVPSSGANASRPAPSVRGLLAFATVLALVTVVTRIYFPIESSFYNFQLCYFPQYIAAFAVGLAAARHGWLPQLAASRRARVAGWLAVIGGPLTLLLLIALVSTSGGPGPKSLFGGWSPQALGMALWEQFAGLGLALGLMALFRRRFDRGGPVARWLSLRSFAVYVIHPPVLVALTLLFRPLPLSPALHIALLTVAGVGLSFAVADAAKRVPGLRRIL